MKNKIVIGTVIAIIGTLFFIFGYFLLSSHYSRTIEKSRQAEAKWALKELKTACVAAFENSKNLDSAIENINKKIIGNAEGIPGPEPNDCISTYYFYYSLTRKDTSTVAFVATRCVNNGKKPQGVDAYNLKLITDCSIGKDNWETSFDSSTRIPYTAH